MPTTIEMQQINRDLAQQLIDEAKRNPQAAYIGKFVGIANGQVAVVADDWDEVARRLHEIEPDPAKTFGVEVGRDYDEVQEIWGCANAPSEVAFA